MYARVDLCVSMCNYCALEENLQEVEDTFKIVLISANELSLMRKMLWASRL